VKPPGFPRCDKIVTETFLTSDGRKWKKHPHSPAKSFDHCRTQPTTNCHKKKLMKKTLLTTIGLAAVTLAGVIDANAFTIGNLVISRVGDGSGTLSNAAWNIDLLEVTTAGAVQQTINVPTTGGSRLTASGTATSELKIRSNGQYLAVTGYDVAVGTANVAGTTDPRRVLVYNNSGNVSTTLTFTGGAGSPYGANNIRGAIPTADGTAAWTAGHENTSGTPNGFYYLTGSSETQLVSGNVRTVDIFGGQLYGTTAAGTDTRAFTIGSGLPTTSGQTIGNLTGLPTSGMNYGSMQIFDLDANVAGFDTIYLSNGSNIEKYSLVSGTWTLNNTASVTSAFMDFTAIQNGTTVDIYAVTATDLFRLTDTAGYNANISGTFGSSLLSAGTNFAFRGIDVAPVPEPSTWALLAGSLTVLTILRRRRRNLA
jgi:hypothetical protein